MGFPVDFGENVQLGSMKKGWTLGVKLVPSVDVVKTVQIGFEDKGKEQMMELPMMAAEALVSALGCKISPFMQWKPNEDGYFIRETKEDCGVK